MAARPRSRNGIVGELPAKREFLLSCWWIPILDPHLVALAKARLGRDEEDDRSGRLSSQERRILDLIAEGKTNREIAGALYLGEKAGALYLGEKTVNSEESRDGGPRLQWPSDTLELTSRGPRIASACEFER